MALRRRSCSLTFCGAAALLVVAAGCAGTLPAAPAKVADGMLVGTNGMTLHVLDRDMASSGKSVCNGLCAQNWPPLAAAAGAASTGDWSVISRDDGSKQWACKDKPVNFQAKDQKAGDRTGDGVNGVWRLAKP